MEHIKTRRISDFDIGGPVRDSREGDEEYIACAFLPATETKSNTYLGTENSRYVIGSALFKIDRPI